MTKALSSAIRIPSVAVLAVCGAIALAGCQSIDFYDQRLQEPVPPLMEPPREKSLVSLPAYRIAAPDVLNIEMLKQVPLPPYRAEAYDVLKINVVGTLPGYPIGPTDDYGQPTPSGGNYIVEAEGALNLGAAYGTVRVVGMTIEEIQEAIEQHLRKILTQPEVSVQLARTSGTKPVTGQYLVGPDGTVNLGQYGAVHVAGKTVAEAKAAMEKHLAQYFDSPEASVDVLSYNSQVYYIITEGARMGDNVVRVPITGKEKVLDAITTVGGLSQLSSKNVWIARPVPGNYGCEQHLPVDWDAIAHGASTATNYQLMPGDRVFIAENDTIAFTNLLGEIAGPFERVAGILSLTTNTVRNLQTLGRSYNRSFRR